MPKMEQGGHDVHEANHGAEASAPSAVVIEFPRRPIEEIFAETAARLRGRNGVPELERRALLAVIEGDHREVQRLIRAIRKRNELNLALV